MSAWESKGCGGSQTLTDLFKPLQEAKIMEVYDLYQNGVFEKRGTLRELSNYTTLSRATLNNFTYPNHLKKPESDGVTKLYKVTKI